MTIVSGLEGHVDRYRHAVGGGSGSQRVSDALHSRGLLSGVHQFFEECVFSGIKAMNTLGVSHAHIGEYAALFVVASPIVAELVSLPLTRDFGVAIANNTPVLAAGWASSSSPSEEFELDSFQRAERMAGEFGRDLGASETRQRHPEAEQRTPGEIINMYGTKKK